MLPSSVYKFLWGHPLLAFVPLWNSTNYLLVGCFEWSRLIQTLYGVNYYLVLVVCHLYLYTFGLIS